MRMSKRQTEPHHHRARACSRWKDETLLGVSGAGLLKGGLVSWTPAADCVGMEAGHSITVSPIDLDSIADVDIAWSPLRSRALPRSVHDVPVKSNTDWCESLSHAAHHVS